MRPAAVALALLLSPPAFGQSWDVLLAGAAPARPPEEIMEVAVSAGLTLFDVSNGDFTDGTGIGALGNISVYGRGADYGMVEIGFFNVGLRQKVSDNPFTLEMLTVGGGYRWSVGGTRLSMGTTGGLIYYYSPDIDEDDEFHDGLYASFFAAAHVSGPVGFYLRFTGMFVGGSGEIDDESLDWITATTIGVDVQF